jgi:hypothetical protein
MKAYIIQSGHFSKAGNFIGFSTMGERIHIYKKQIFEEFPMAEIVHRCLGVYENAQVKFPFYCVADVLTFNSPDGTTFDRRTAIAISKDKIELKYYSLERSYTELVIENNSLKQSLCDLDYKYDQLEKEHEALVAKVDHYGGNAGLKEENEGLKDEYERLKDDFNASQWENEYIQSERERLELLCKEHENTIMNLQSDDMISKHVIHKINKLTQDYINKLIV